MATLRFKQTRASSTLFGNLGSAFLASLMALSLGACSSTGPGMLTPDGGAPQASLTDSSATPVSAQTAKVQIAPVIGSPDTVAHSLQTELASAIGRNGLTVATSANATSEYTLRGYIVAAREKTKAKISYIWDVTDRTGKRVHRITGEEIAPGGGKDPWSAVDQQVVQRIAEKTAKQLSTWLPTSSTIMASNTSAGAATAAAPHAAPAASNNTYATASNAPATQAATTGSIATAGPITAVVPNVTGAPGDGGVSLTSAIQRELSKSGLALATTPNPQSYKVEGKVALGAGKDGKQPIQIDWNVLDPTGKKLGTVSQKNEVPQGSLDGAWGKTADAAAAAAAAGIIKLIPAKSVN